MTWEETVVEIRKRADFRKLIEQSYLESDLKLNVERFKDSEEFHETLKIIRQYAPGFHSIMDIGAGNGIGAIAFALSNYEVTAVEPDPSNTVGCGAINVLKEQYGLKNINVHSGFGEQIPFNDSSFDVIYFRQAMHHAKNLKKFVSEASRVLKQGGLMISVRDHIIYNEKDKQWFLDSHPLHKYYDGENAYTLEEYIEAIKSSGLELKKTLKHYDSLINYFPLSKDAFINLPHVYEKQLRERVTAKFGFLSHFKFFRSVYKSLSEIKNGKLFDERKLPGRMYSFIAIKK